MDRIRLQLDEHIPNAVARALRSRGIDVLTTAEAGLLGVADWQILDRSYAEGRVLVTNDSDFLELHNLQRHHAGVAYCRQRKRNIGQLVSSLVLIYEILQPDEIVGRVEFV